WGWVYANEFNTVLPVLRHSGVWIVPILAGAATAILAARRLPSVYGVPLFVAAAIPFALGGVSYLLGARDLPWAIVSLTASLAFSGALLGGLRDNRLDLRFAGVCIVAGAFLMAGVELMFLLDRMNTIFKFYNAIWFMLGTGAIIAA